MKNTTAVGNTGAQDVTITLIPIAMIEEGTNARKTYDAQAIAELAASIAEHGLAQPILVSPRGVSPKGETTSYDLVAGYRRFRAMVANGATVIPSYIRDLTPDEISNLQTVENMQRVDLPPLDEAQLYADMMKKGKTAADCSRIAGRHVSHVHRRVGLLKLSKAVQKKLASGELPVSHAELLGRIPDDKLQTQALDAMFTDRSSNQIFLQSTKQWVTVPPQPVSEAMARKIIETSYMLDISKAPFDPKDPDLSPLGPCTTCPYLTGNSRDLFGDVSTASMCTNPPDYDVKVNAWLKVKEEMGGKILTAAKAKEVFRHPHSVDDKWVDLDDSMWTGSKQTMLFALLTREQHADVVYAYHAQRLRRVMPKEVFEQACKLNGVFKHDSTGGVRRSKSKDEIDRDWRMKIEKAIGKATQEAFIVAVQSGKKKISFEDWVSYLANVVVVDKGWQLDDVLPRHTGDDVKKTKLGAPGGGRIGMARKLVTGMVHSQKLAFVIDALTNTWSTGNAGPEKNRVFADGATLLGVDSKGIAEGVRAEFKAKRDAKAEKDKKSAAKTKPAAKKKPPAKKVNGVPITRLVATKKKPAKRTTRKK